MILLFKNGAYSSALESTKNSAIFFFLSFSSLLTLMNKGITETNNTKKALCDPWVLKFAIPLKTIDSIEF